MLTASAGLARDKGLRSAVRKHLKAGDDLLTALGARRSRAVRAGLHPMGGLMAERVTDLRDIERRVVAHLVGEPEPGVQMPDTPVVLVAEDLAPVGHRGAGPAGGAGAGDRARRADQPHRDHRRASSAIPCVVGIAGLR